MKATKEIAVRFLEAWNTHDVDTVANIYSEDVTYLDPNTRGAIESREAMRRYLTKLFAAWKMHYELVELQTGDQDGKCSVKWAATFQRRGDGQVIHLQGLDIVEFHDGLVTRNEVYFDRSALFAGAA